MKIVLSVLLFTGAWFAVDLVNAAPPHVLWHFWDQRSVGGLLTMLAAIGGYEMIRSYVFHS